MLREESGMHITVKYLDTWIFANFKRLRRKKTVLQKVEEASLAVKLN